MLRGLPNKSTLHMTEYPKYMVQRMVSYLYTGIMEQPQGTGHGLFKQLLDEYGLTPYYTIDPETLEIIGKTHDAIEPERLHLTPKLAANCELQNEIKQEVDDTIQVQTDEDQSMSDGDEGDDVDDLDDDKNSEDDMDFHDDTIEHKDANGRSKEREDWSTIICAPSIAPVKDRACAKSKSAKGIVKGIKPSSKLGHQIEISKNVKSTLNSNEEIEIKEEIVSEYPIDEHLQSKADDDNQINKTKEVVDNKHKPDKRCTSDDEAEDDDGDKDNGDDWMLDMEKEFVKYRERHECEVCENGFTSSSQEIDHFYEVWMEQGEKPKVRWTNKMRILTLAKMGKN